MIQNDNSSAFCNKHNDYMIEIVCVDYLSKECQYMCKKCFKSFNISNSQQKDQQFQLKQQQFQDECMEEERKLDSYLQEKIQLLSNKFNSDIQAGLVKLMDSFRKSFQNSLKSIKDFETELTKINNQYPKLKKIHKENLELAIKKQQQLMNDLRIESIKNKVSYLDELKNKLIDTALNLENQIFSEHLLGQQLYEIPNPKTIFKNFDTNNLLLSFEQLFLLKYQYITEQDNEQKINLYEQEFKQIDQEHIEIKGKIHKQYKKIKQELDEQKKQMLARFKKYQDWVIQNNDKIIQCRKETQVRVTEIQDMNDQDFVNQLKRELANKKLKDYFDEFRETLSKICHLGYYDIKVSLEEIESNFKVKLIPAKMLYDINHMENNILLQHPQATDIHVDLNEKGDVFNLSDIQFKENPIIQESKEQTKMQISENEKQIGNSTKQFKDQSLFHFDLSKLFPNSQNKFNYTIIRTEEGQESYIENDNQWQLTISQNNKYNFIVYPNKQNKIEFQDIVINSENQVDENNIIKVNYFDKNHLYEGQINNHFEYSGQGKLIQNGIIKEGIWKDGKLEGEGKIIENGIEIYVGQFSSGFKQGVGIEFLISDLYYQGQFEKDEKHGQGKIVKKKDNEYLIIEENIKWKNGQSQNDVCRLF